MIVSEEHLDAKTSNCLVCGDSSGFWQQFVIQAEPLVTMRKCKNCFACSADRMPNPKFLEQLYDPAHYEATLTSNIERTTKLVKRILNYWTFSDQKSFKILDYGGGNGNLTRAVISELRKQFPNSEFRGYVVDILSQETDGEISFLSNEQFNETTEKFDIVMASAILEHIPQMQTILERLLSVGKPGALFYGRAPYEAPLVKIVPGMMVRWPRHIHDLGPLFWESLQERYSDKVEIVMSRPSLVESTFSDSFFRTFAAYVLKAPGHMEAVVRNGLRYPPLWRFVGGWEAYGRFR